MGKFAAFFWSVLTLRPAVFLFNEDDDNRQPLLYAVMAAVVFLAVYYAFWPYDPLGHARFPIHVHTGIALADAVIGAAIGIFAFFLVATLPVAPALLLSSGWHGLKRLPAVAAYVFASVPMFLYLWLTGAALLAFCNLTPPFSGMQSVLFFVPPLLYLPFMLYRLFKAAVPCRGWQALIALTLYIVGFTATNYFIDFKIARIYYTDGITMSPNLADGEFVFVSRWNYDRPLQPKRGDIILFEKRAVSNRTRISRVIGVPGDTIVVQQELVILNGRLLTYEPWPENLRYRYREHGPDPVKLRLTNEWLDGQFGQTIITFGDNPDRWPHADLSSGTIELKPCEYFVLGDNRSIADDSRNPDVGIIRCNEIDGIVVGKVLPLFRFVNPLRPRLGPQQFWH